MGIPITKILVIWASLVTLTLILTVTQIARVIWEEDAHITRVLGMVQNAPPPHPTPIPQIFEGAWGRALEADTHAGPPVSVQLLEIYTPAEYSHKFGIGVCRPGS